MAQAMKRSQKLVAVVVPMHDRLELTDDENTSIRHLLHFLGAYDKYALVPNGVDLELPGFALKKFNKKYFGSQQANTRLMLSRILYETFIDYQYILVYHLDAVVFSDQLKEWCRTGLDYIGAPWLNLRASPEQGFSGVGNGGFSLRKITSFLRVFESRRWKMEPADYAGLWDRDYSGKPLGVRLVNLPRKYLKHLKRFNSLRWELARFRRNEDYFWDL